MQDINALPNSRTTKAFLEFMQVLSDTTQYTYKSTSPSKCIDYIYGCGAKFVRPRTTVIKNSVASDHMPLYVDLKIKKK